MVRELAEIIDNNARHFRCFCRMLFSELKLTCPADRLRTCRRPTSLSIRATVRVFSAAGEANGDIIIDAYALPLHLQVNYFSVARRPSQIVWALDIMVLYVVKPRSVAAALVRFSVLP